jgi:3-carboxy-cis,cis-muconate cycloisomerase
MKLSSSTSSGGLTGPLFGDPAVDAAVDDAAFVRAMLEAEAALALASADVGVLPQGAASAIAATCGQLDVDLDALGRASVSSGNPVVPLVRLIGDATEGDAGTWVHHGATSQDIIDTALMLMSQHAGARIVDRLWAAADACATLAADHRGTLMVARTLGQQAAPTTFGRKAAGWLLALSDATDRLAVVCRDRLAAQLGGPVGTLAAFGADGERVAAAYAHRLGLGRPVLPWHTDRLRVLDLAAALGSVAAVADKIATDVLLMAQSEVGEVSLAVSGGSSSMPHKHNPVDAVLVRAGTARVPGLVATLFAAAAPEHERATGAWHSEWQPWRELLSVAGGVANRTADLLEGLRVDATRMRANLAVTGGLVMAESVAARLAGPLGRTAAHDLVARCVELAGTTGRPFADVLAADPDVTAHLDRDAISAALDPTSWLGSSATMVDRALESYRATRSGPLSGDRAASS